MIFSGGEIEFRSGVATMVILIILLPFECPIHTLESPLLSIHLCFTVIALILIIIELAVESIAILQGGKYPLNIDVCMSALLTESASKRLASL